MGRKYERGQESHVGFVIEGLKGAEHYTRGENAQLVHGAFRRTLMPESQHMDNTYQSKGSIYTSIPAGIEYSY